MESPASRFRDSHVEGGIRAPDQDWGERTIAYDTYRTVELKGAGTRGGHMAVTFESVRRMALALEKVEEGASYGTAVFKVGGALIARLRQGSRFAGAAQRF